MTIHALVAAKHPQGNASTSPHVNTTAIVRHSSSNELSRAAQAELARADQDQTEYLQTKLSRLIESFRAITRDILYVVFELGQSFAASWQTRLNL